MGLPKKPNRLTRSYNAVYADPEVPDFAKLLRESESAEPTANKTEDGTGPSRATSPERLPAGSAAS
jgi:hypothetical protein